MVWLAGDTHTRRGVPTRVEPAGAQRGDGPLCGHSPRLHIIMSVVLGKPGNTGPLRALNALRYSAWGLAHAWRHESSFRQEIILTAALTPVALWLGRSVLEIVLLLGCCALVMIVELLNSAIEAAVDRHGDEIHELSGRAKDLGSAAVFVTMLLTWAVWAAVAYDRFFAAAPGALLP